MTTESQAVEAILQQWEDGWEALHPADDDDPDYVPYSLDNESFDAVARWARVTILHDDRAQHSMGPSGSRRELVTGNIVIQVYADVNEGRGAVSTLCDDVRTAMQLRSLTIAGSVEPVRIFSGATRNETTDGRWRTATVVLSFDYYTMS